MNYPKRFYLGFPIQNKTWQICFWNAQWNGKRVVLCRTGNNEESAMSHHHIIIIIIIIINIITMALRLMQCKLYNSLTILLITIIMMTMISIIFHNIPDDAKDHISGREKGLRTSYNSNKNGENNQSHKNGWHLEKSSHPHLLSTPCTSPFFPGRSRTASGVFPAAPPAAHVPGFSASISSTPSDDCCLCARARNKFLQVSLYHCIIFFSVGGHWDLSEPYMINYDHSQKVAVFPSP